MKATETEEDIRRRELPINRAIHKLRNGTREEEITAASIGVLDTDLAETVRTAKRRMEQNDQQYADVTRWDDTGYIIFGLVMLTFAYFLSETDVSLLRQGRLLAGIALGAASLGWGLSRFFVQPRT